MDKPRVKPLTFHTVGDGRMALSPVGPYRVLEQPDGYFDVMFDGCLVNRRKKGEAFTNCEAAEAWTQTRHEKQVLACIAALEPVTVQEAALMLADHIDNDTEAANRMIEAYVSITSLDTLVSHWLSQCIRALAEKGE